MEKLFITLLFTIAISIVTIQSYSQGMIVLGPAQIYTPNGNLVPDTYYMTCQQTLPELISIAQRQKQLYPNAIELGAPSCAYNCHAYAWHLSEDLSREPVWIGYDDIGAYAIDASYLAPNDGSYEEVDRYYSMQDFENGGGGIAGAKVYYIGSNHSAIVDEQSGSLFISKWGAGYLMKHTMKDSPYSIDEGLVFYKRASSPNPIPPTISGPDILCSSGGTYTINNVPAGAAVTWEYSSGIVELDRGTSWIKFRAISGSEATISAIVNGTRVSKEIWAGLPSTYEWIISGPTRVNENGGGNYSVEQYTGQEMGVDSYFWSTSTGGFIEENGYLRTFAWFGMSGQRYIQVSIGNQCGSTIVGPYYVQVGGGMSYQSFPSPANNNLTIELKDKQTTANTESKAFTKNINTARSIQLYNIQQQLISTTHFEANSNSVVLNVSDLPNGTYFLNILENGKVVEQQTLMVKH